MVNPKLKLLKKICIDEDVSLGLKSLSFKRSYKNTNKLKGISKSQSKDKKFEEFKKWLDGENIKKDVINIF